MFQFFAKFPFILFRGMLILRHSDDEPSSISESSDVYLSLSLSDSSEDELYFLFLDPLPFLLGQSCLLFFWPSLFFASTFLKFYQVAGFLMEPFQLE